MSCMVQLSSKIILLNVQLRDISVIMYIFKFLTLRQIVPGY